MSSIWEESHETRLVWVTLLALADQNGHVDGTVKSLARVARVTVEECEQALECLLGPDPHDRSGVLEGRRIVVEQGGWRLVNHGTYRAKMSADERREKDRVRKRQQRVSAECPQRPQTSENVRDFQQAEAEAEAEAQAEQTTPPASIRRTSSSLLVGPLEREKAAKNFRFYGARVRVPHVLHRELEAKLGGDNPDGALMEWYADLDAEYELSKAPIPDIFASLRPRFAAWAQQASTEAMVKAWVAGDAHGA